MLHLAGAQGREQLLREVERMLSEALQAIFGSGLRVRVELSERNRRPWAEIKVETPLSDGRTLVADPLDAHGGGVVDALSLALRIMLVESARPPLAGPLLLDEPGKHLSHEYLPRLAEFLIQVAQAFGRQILLVTHADELAAAGERAYRVERDGDRSRVRPAPAGRGRG